MKQSSGRLVQLPFGQSRPPRAEHWPVQLTPWPQDTIARVRSDVQQETSLMFTAKLNEFSKKSSEVELLVTGKVKHEKLKLQARTKYFLKFY